MADDLDHDVLTFWSLLFDIVRDAEKRLAAHTAAHDLTPPQFYVLKTLSEHGGRCRIGQIAAEHHLTNATMTGLIKRLEATMPPLVTRSASAEDKRAVDVTWTPEGEARYWDIQRGLMAQAHDVLNLLPPEERREVIERVRAYFNMLVNLHPVRDEKA